MICFSKQELVNLYKKSKAKEFVDEISKKGYSYEELKADDKKNEIVDIVVNRGLKDKTEVEIFAALFNYLSFYSEESEVCFMLKDSFSLSRNNIVSFRNLKDVIKEYELTDFGILSGNELRQFQLKRYRNNLDIESLFGFIKDKIANYGNNLADVNLLISLQTENRDISKINFHVLSEKLNSYQFKSQGEILISYNEENKFNVINKVYPGLATCRIPFNSSKSIL